MSEQTHVFKLVSGVECEVVAFTGKHQRLLTEQKNKTLSDNLVKLLAATIVRLGDDTQITEQTIKEMLSTDRKHALVEARQFTHDFEDQFVFGWKYLSKKTNSEEVENFSIDLKDGVFETVPMEKQYTSYAEVLADKDVTVTLPKSGMKVTFSRLDYTGETIAAGIKKEDRNSHTAILIHNPRYLETEGKPLIKMTERELDLMALKDIEYLRSAIKKAEGQVHTELRVEHPEAGLPGVEKEVIIDLLGQIAFFFPSEAI